jgi:hypothetical protein
VKLARQHLVVNPMLFMEASVQVPVGCTHSNPVSVIFAQTQTMDPGFARWNVTYYKSTAALEIPVGLLDLNTGVTLGISMWLEHKCHSQAEARADLITTGLDASSNIVAPSLAPGICAAYTGTVEEELADTSTISQSFIGI